MELGQSKRAYVRCPNNDYFSPWLYPSITYQLAEIRSSLPLNSMFLRCPFCRMVRLFFRLKFMATPRIISRRSDLSHQFVGSGARPAIPRSPQTATGSLTANFRSEIGHLWLRDLQSGPDYQTDIGGLQQRGASMGTEFEDSGLCQRLRQGATVLRVLSSSL